MALACHRESGFVLMQHLCLHKRGLDLLLDLRQLLGTSLPQAHNGRDRDGMTEQIKEQLADPFIGQDRIAPEP